MKINKDIFNLFIVLTSAFSFLFGLFYYHEVASGYEYIIIFPIIYLVFYILILQSLRRSKYLFTAYGIIIMQWIRFVLMPPIIIAAGDFAGMSYINPSSTNINFAIVLMVYEFIFISIISYLLLMKKNNSLLNSQSTKKIEFMGNKLIYFIFILVAFILSLTVGINNNLLHFAVIPIDTGEGTRIGDVTDTFLVLVRQIILIALFLIFMWTVHISKQFYEKKIKNVYVDIAILAALLNVGVIVGERRTAQIYTALVCIYLLILVYPKFKRKIIANVGLVALIILFFMSIYKFLAAYTQGSYVVAIGNSNLDISWLSRTLQSYFFGPENIAATLEFNNTFNSSTINMLYDFLRSTFGLSFFVKDDGMMTSAAFNTYIYGVNRLTGHVISSVGYGVIYFGVIFAPVFALINIYISTKIESFMKKSMSYEMTFLWGYVLVRFVTNLFVSTPPLISYGTMMLGTAGLLFFVAISLKRKSHIQL